MNKVPDLPSFSSQTFQPIKLLIADRLCHATTNGIES